MEQKFDALIWVICAFRNELKMSQIDASRDFGFFSVFQIVENNQILNGSVSESLVLIQAVIIYR